MREKSKITKEELYEKYGLNVGDVISMKDAPQHGHVLLAWYAPDNTVIPVYLAGNYAADLLPLEYILSLKYTITVHTIKASGLIIS